VWPVSGNNAAAGVDMLNGWNLWFKLHGDTVQGHKIVSQQEDSAGDPTTTLTKARQLIQQNQSKAIVGPLTAAEGYALAGLMQQNPNVIGLAPVTSSDDLSQRKRVQNFIRTGGWQSSTPTQPAGNWAADRGMKRVATLCADYAFGYEQCGGFANTFTDRGGQVVKQLWAPMGTADYSSYLAQIDPKSVDGVFVSTVGADSPRFLKAWNQLGLKGKVPLITGETTLEQSTLRGINSDDPVGLTSFGHYAEGSNDPATQDFVSQYQKAYGQIPSYYSCATYTAAQWLTQALNEAHGDLSDTKRFIGILNSVKLPDSCFGPMQLDSHGGTVGNVYQRTVARNAQGKLQNNIDTTFPNISQFWNYNPDAFLKQPVYSRQYQGINWPTSCAEFVRDCPLPGGH
jgi:branched-chain amino acid transport system substrate-binding protein